MTLVVKQLWEYNHEELAERCALKECEIDSLTAEVAELQGYLQSCHAVNADLMVKEARLRTTLEDALLVLEVQFGKKAEPGSLIYQIRKALANEQSI